MSESIDNWFSRFCSAHNLFFFGKGLMEEDKNVVYFEKKDISSSEWVIKIDADMQVISISIRLKDHDSNSYFIFPEKEKEIAEYLLENISKWKILGLSNVFTERTIYTIDEIKTENLSYHFFYSEKYIG